MDQLDLKEVVVPLLASQLAAAPFQLHLPHQLPFAPPHTTPLAVVAFVAFKINTDVAAKCRCPW
jgi:hypothetical protein